MGSIWIDTARCAGCGVYTTPSDLERGPDGRGYCCGIPAAAYTSEGSWPQARGPEPTGRGVGATRVVIAVMLAVTAAFPLAALCSQL